MDQGPLTITAAAPLIQRGELTPSDLLEQCLARLDRYEEKVRAWVYLDRERARAEAAQLTDEIKRGHYRGPLHGIPVGIKDIIDVFDMPTGCGSKLWANSYARRDATCVQRLREAGALILGKTVTTPYAFLDPPPTRNPWNLERTPGGSSSGSAAAVACGMCLTALGTQTGGSITRPASYCGVCSLKPSWYQIGVDGVYPLAPTLDHVGVLANGVWDLAAVYREVSLLPEVSDAQGPPTPSSTPPNIFVLRGLFDDLAEPVVRDMIADVVRRLSLAGAEVSVTDPPEGFRSIHWAHRVVMASEAAAHHERPYQQNPEHYPPRITELIRDGLSRSALEYVRSKQLASWVKYQLVEQADEKQACYLTPAAPNPAPLPDTTGDAVFNSPWSLCGLPTVSIPAGWTPDGLPLGIQLVGTSTLLGGLFSKALWCERALGAGPRRLPTLE